MLSIRILLLAGCLGVACCRVGVGRARSRSAPADPKRRQLGRVFPLSLDKTSPRFRSVRLPYTLPTRHPNPCFSFLSSVKPTSNAVSWPSGSSQTPIRKIRKHRTSRIPLRRTHHWIREQTGLQQGRQKARNLRYGGLQFCRVCIRANPSGKPFTLVSPY